MNETTEGTPVSPGAFGGAKASEDAAIMKEMEGVSRRLDEAFGTIRPRVVVIQPVPPGAPEPPRPAEALSHDHWFDAATLADMIKNAKGEHADDVVVDDDFQLVDAVAAEADLERGSSPVVEMSTGGGQETVERDVEGPVRVQPGEREGGFIGGPANSVSDDEEQAEAVDSGPTAPGMVGQNQPIVDADDVDAGHLGSVGLFDIGTEQGGDKRGRFSHVKRFLRRLVRRRDSSSKRVGI